MLLRGVILALGLTSSLFITPSVCLGQSSEAQSTSNSSSVRIRRLSTLHVQFSDSLLSEATAEQEEECRAKFITVDGPYDPAKAEAMKAALVDFWKERGVDASVRVAATPVPDHRNYLAVKISVYNGVTPPPVEAPPQTRTEAIAVARIIFSTEMNYQREYGHFATWSELYDSGYITRDARDFEKASGMKIEKGPEVLPRLKLALIVTPAEDTYSAAVHVAGDAEGFSVFGDSSTPVYQTQRPDEISGRVHDLIRAIRDAEASYSATYGRFETLDSLGNAGPLSTDGQKVGNLDEARKAMPDSDVSLIVSPTHDTWALAIHEQRADGSVASYFSDPSGAVYASLR